MRATISGKRSTLPAKRHHLGNLAPLLVLFNKDGCLASKNIMRKANSEAKPITDIDMPKDMLQIINWITNVPCHVLFLIPHSSVSF